MISHYLVQRRVRLAAVLAAVLLASLVIPTGVDAAPSGGAGVAGTLTPALGDVRPSDPTSARDEVDKLEPGWRSSPDQLLLVTGDATGLHLLTARESEAYAWRTLANLSEPGMETDRWVGNACLTPSGRHAVVVYAPRSFTNEASLYLRGGFVAVVDMVTGQVRKLPVRANLAYFDPGCGSGEQALVTASRFPEESGAMTTRLYRIDASTSAVSDPIELRGQISSAVPTPEGIVATRGNSIVGISDTGRVSTLATETTRPFMLKADGAGGVVYLTGDQAANQARRLVPRAGNDPTTVATSSDGWLGLSSGLGGRVLVTGSNALAHDLPAQVTMVAADSGDQVSALGHLVLEQQAMPNPRTDPDGWRRAQTLQVDDSGAQIQRLVARVVPSGATLHFSVAPGLRPLPGIESGAAGRSLASTRRPIGAARTVDSAVLGRTAVGGTAEPMATCSVPRNDPRTQVYQPTAHQVEWAVDQAVAGNLLTARPDNWKHSGLTSWAPQGMFPKPALASGGAVPPQILLGILAQESNLWQATGHALPGEFGNPLIGDYYGRDGGWTVNFSAADCGYGIGQVTDGMRKASATPSGAVPAMEPKQQRAVALDYATNIAKSLQILSGKWNETWNANLRHDNGTPDSIENWIFAVWAYNTGFYPYQGDGVPWGVGWFNNPANPVYPANRTFFNADITDAQHPADWPYEEKVIGWAAYSIATPDGPGFQTAGWSDSMERDRAKPPVYTFCDADNNCTADTANPCPSVDETCWWHKPVTYHDCTNGYCGYSFASYDGGDPEQPDGTNFPPRCTLSGLPTGSLIIDDLPDSVPAPRAGCGHPWKNRGTFGLTFSDPAGRIDFHQIGGGFGGHFWFAHTRKSTDQLGKMQVTGKWTYSTAVRQWGRLMVHMPDHGAHTQQARYRINLGDGVIKTRYALQRTRAHKWVDLGVFRFNGYPTVSLSSTTWDGAGADDIAFDAVAIKPLAAKPRNFVVAMGDSYSSGEGVNNPDGGDDYYPETDFGGSYGKNDPRRNACHRSPYAWARKSVLKDSTTPIGQRADTWDPRLDFQLAACSGAESENLLPYYSVPAGTAKPKNAEGQTGRGQYGEAPSFATIITPTSP